MRNAPTRITRPPAPTWLDPYAQIKWMFFQVEQEFTGLSAARFSYARNKYISFIIETNADYDDLKTDRRFYMAQHWESDALQRFTKWLIKQDLRSRTRYSLYKATRQVMHMAYGLRVIDTVIHPSPIYKGGSETKQRAAYSASEQEIINAAIARWIGLANSVLSGYEKSGHGIPYRRPNPPESLIVNGTTYTVEQAAEAFKVKRTVILGRMKNGFSPEAAVGIVKTENTGLPRQVTVEGTLYHSINEAASTFGTSSARIRNLLRRGHSPEQSVGLVPIHVLSSDERALLWVFENDFEGDALAMYNHFLDNKKSSTCSIKRLRTLFIRWGVWAHVDDRIIMPLAFELGMLTGLNPEAIKELEIDSFQLEHPLTRQPVLSYVKNRGASPTQPAEKDLHLPLLEREDHVVEDSSVDKVATLIGLVLKLTERIRPHAAEDISRRLFIFEDVELSRSTGTTAIVPIDPKGKTALWYERFCREEGLYNIFGAKFNFSLARCRPTLATNMVLAGATLYEIQATFGHKNIQTTAEYVDQHGLKPVFNREVSEALSRIAERSKNHDTQEKEIRFHRQKKQQSQGQQFCETLSGCGCNNPYDPSENVRKATKHVEGAVCRNWNMCVRCDSAIVTEKSLPKLIVYRRRVQMALESESPAIRSRKELFEDICKLIDGILTEDVIFPASVLRDAEYVAASLDDSLVDHLIYQGI
ncbi:site-specific integrase [Paraburkholderia caledonica]|uniref:hypothetical protein n=1 Tax=Paraburkholderia caledonica TaxID=134536 RepID=UPI0038B6F2B6